MSMPKVPFALTEDDKHSPLWLKLMGHFESKLESLRMQNDSEKSETETARLRGRIAAIKECMALNNDLPDLEAPPR